MFKYYNLCRTIDSINEDEISSIFADDGSIEYKEFIDQLVGCIKCPHYITNFYTAVIVSEGINKFKCI